MAPAEVGEAAGENGRRLSPSISLSSRAKSRSKRSKTAAEEFESRSNRFKLLYIQDSGVEEDRVAFAQRTNEELFVLLLCKEEVLAGKQNPAFTSRGRRGFGALGPRTHFITSRQRPGASS